MTVAEIIRDKIAFYERKVKEYESKIDEIKKEENYSSIAHIEVKYFQNIIDHAKGEIQAYKKELGEDI